MTLIAPVQDEDVAGLDFAGAGVLSSAADLREAAQTGDPEHLAVAAEAFAIDLVGVAMDPLGELLQGTVGWLIEHVWFLHEPLDALAGDPQQIKAQAQTWLNASRAMTALAETYPAEAAAVRWAGAAAEEYRAAVDDYAHHLERAAGAARGASEEILASAAAVGTLRSLIRDLVAAFVAEAIEKALLAMATALPTSGASLAACAALVAVEAVDLARDNIHRISRLLDDLDASALRLADLEKIMERVRDMTAEAGKQSGEARQDQREWSQQPVPAGP